MRITYAQRLKTTSQVGKSQFVGCQYSQPLRRWTEGKEEAWVHTDHSQVVAGRWLAGQAVAMAAIIKYFFCFVREGRERTREEAHCGGA